MADVHAEIRRNLDQIHELTRTIAELCDDLDPGDILTDIVVIAGTIDPSTHLASVLYYSRPETPAYTIRGLVQICSEDMAAVSVANAIDTDGWDGGETDDE